MLFSNKGFSLLELIITTAIIAVVFSLITTRWDTGTHSLSSDSKQLVNTLRYARHLALTKEEKIDIKFNTVHGTYGLYNASNVLIQRPYRDSHGNIETHHYSLNNGTTIMLNNVIDDNLISFNKDGIPYTGTTSTQLTTDATITLMHAGQPQKTITIIPETGYIDAN